MFINPRLLLGRRGAKAEAELFALTRKGKEKYTG
jgi:hypothetical protein